MLKIILSYMVIAIVYSIIILGFVCILYLILRLSTLLTSLIIKRLGFYKSIIEYFIKRKQFKEYLQNEK